MKKNVKEEDKGRAQEPLEVVKPKRGRKPKTEKQQEEAGAAAEMEAVQEADTTTEPETAQEAEEIPAAETEPAVQESADTEQTGTPPETAPEADTESQNDTAEESAMEAGNAREGATAEDNGTEKSGEEPEPEKEEKVPVPVPAPAASTQVIDSPLKRMKQEFSERAQIIREQMRNIQNAFITIGFQLHWIRENNMFRVLNYKNVYEYAEKEYGLKKTTCCNFISIIENYAERDENGQVIESIADCYRNYSASQLVAMLGMNEDMRQQVTPDMSVRAINRLRKGEPESGTAEAERYAPVEEKKAETQTPDRAISPAEEGEKPETMEAQEPEEPAAESSETVDDDTAHEEEREEPEETATYGDDAVEHTEEAAHAEGDTLAEIDSYTDYQSMQDELDLIMRHVFSADAPVRVKIVCVQG